MSDELKCSKCNTRNPKGSEYCNSCGKQLGTDCTKCGHTNPQDTLYCNKCGSETEHQLDIRTTLEVMAIGEKLKQKQEEEKRQRVLEEERKAQAIRTQKHREWLEAEKKRIAELPKWRQKLEDDPLVQVLIGVLIIVALIFFVFLTST